MIIFNVYIYYVIYCIVLHDAKWFRRVTSSRKAIARHYPRHHNHYHYPPSVSIVEHPPTGILDFEWSSGCSAVVNHLTIWICFPFRRWITTNQWWYILYHVNLLFSTWHILLLGFRTWVGIYLICEGCVIIYHLI